MNTKAEARVEARMYNDIIAKGASLEPRVKEFIAKKEAEA